MTKKFFTLSVKNFLLFIASSRVYVFWKDGSHILIQNIKAVLK